MGMMNNPNYLSSCQTASSSVLGFYGFCVFGNVEEDVGIFAFVMGFFVGNPDNEFVSPCTGGSVCQ